MSDEERVESGHTPGGTPQKATPQAGLDKDRGAKGGGAKVAEGGKGGAAGAAGQGGGGGRDKPKTRAERAALQEAQRAAKAARAGQQGEGGGGGSRANKGGGGCCWGREWGGGGGSGGGDKDDEKSVTSGQSATNPPTSTRRGASAKQNALEETQGGHSKMVHLFSHLPQTAWTKRATLARSMQVTRTDLHPAVQSLGLHYACGTIRGTNARSVGMLRAFKEVIKSYHLPPDKVLRIDLDRMIKPHIQFLIDCRPHSISMGFVIRVLRRMIQKIKPEAGEAEVKEDLLKQIDDIIEQITFSAEIVSRSAMERISDGDVVLTYGRSYAVELALKAAHKDGRKFRVIIVDSRPLLEGKRLAQTLSAAGVHVTYMLLNAISYILRSVSKVFLGAAALLSNGAVISRAGTALVAMSARRFNIPTIVCCETYKFSEKVQLDSICWNEVGDPAELAEAPYRDEPPLKGWSEVGSLNLLNLRYDLTPMKYVNLVITEVGLIPPTSVPVLIRESRKDEVALNLDL